MKFRLFFCLLLVSSLGIGPLCAAAPPPDAPSPDTLRVAAVQFRSDRNLSANVRKITQRLAECAAKGVKIIAFPECALSSYYPDFVKTISLPALNTAEHEVADACGKYHINAIVGSADMHSGTLRNAALMIDDRGDVVARYYKMHLVRADRECGFEPGQSLPPVVYLDHVPCTVIICKDSTYPELCRLPVLAGARVVFYISNESPVYFESKLGPYRAIVQSRAVENTVYVVHANAPADGVHTGSHGQSRLVSPKGIILCEASMFREEVLVGDLDLSQSTGRLAKQSLEPAYMGDWWREMRRSVPVIRPAGS